MTNEGQTEVTFAELQKSLTSAGIDDALDILQTLDPEQRDRLLAGNRERYHHLIAEAIAGKKLSRSNAYELRRYNTVALPSIRTACTTWTPSATWRPAVKRRPSSGRSPACRGATWTRRARSARGCGGCIGTCEICGLRR